MFAGLSAGASGFLLKNADADHLIEAVRTVAGGHALLAPEITRRVIAQMTSGAASAAAANDSNDRSLSGIRDAVEVAGADRRLGSLTPREREVLGLVGRGMSNAEIAQELFLGEATVKTHLSNVFSKLHLRDRVQAVVLAYESGLILAGENGTPPPD